MRGRPRKPISLKKLQGTYRKDRDAGGPEPAAGQPKCPEWASDQVRQAFAELAGRLERVGLASETFNEILLCAALRACEVRRLSLFVTEHGETCQSPNSTGALVTKLRPEMAQLNEAMRHLHSLLSELGLTPSSINKAKPSKQKKAVNPFSLIHK